MSVTFVQGASAASQDAVTLTLPLTAQPINTGDNIVLVAMTVSGQTGTFTPTDNGAGGSNTWTQISGSPFDVAPPTQHNTVHVYTTTVHSNNAGGFTIDLAPSNPVFSFAMALQFSGATAFTLDLTANGASNTSPATFSLGSPTNNANEVIVAIPVTQAAGSGQTFTVSAPFTRGTILAYSGPILAWYGYCAMGYDIVTSVGTYSSTWTCGTPANNFGVLTLSFATAPPTYSISGNAGVAGATVAYSGTASGSVTADGSGNYTIPGLANGSYTITPSKTGYIFSPTSANETVSGSNITGVNFTASAVHSISGNAGAAGATVSYSGAASGSAVADSLGNYSLTGLIDGSYTITPTLTGYTFSPASASETLSGSNITGVNFTVVTGDTYIQQAEDTFQRPNENPLNPVNWEVPPIGGEDALLIASHVCRASTGGADCGGIYKGIVWGALVSEYVEVVCAAFDSTGDTYQFFIFVNCDTAETGGPSVIASNDPITDHTLLSLYKSDSTLLGTVTLSSAIQNGDILRIENSPTNGGTVRLFYNGVMLLYGADSSLVTGGYPILDMNVTNTSDVGITDFKAGTINGTIPPPVPAGGQELTFGFDFNF